MRISVQTLFGHERKKYHAIRELERQRARRGVHRLTELIEPETFEKMRAMVSERESRAAAK
jgi:hypothetical protein